MASRKETEKSEKQIAAANGNSNGTKPPNRLKGLMLEMGSDTGRFDPLPPDQHRWQSREGEVPKHRVWSWMVAHTTAQRFRIAGGEIQVGSPWAVDEFGHELHLVNMERDLGMDGGHLRSVWREYRGSLWRNGTKEEGDQRLYLMAKVGGLPEEDQKGEEKAQEVCTHLLPSFIFKKTKDWPPERVAALTNEWKLLSDLDRALRAMLVANGRRFIGQAQDNLLTRYGVKYERQIHHRTGEGEEEEKERQRLGTSLFPAIENFVQTLLPKVSTDSKTALYSLFGGSVQTSIYKELEKRLERDRPNGRAESKPPARPEVVSQSPPHQNGNGTKTEDSWRPALREWLRENCPVKTSLDDVMFERIAFWLRLENLDQFREAALEVKNPRKWAIYEAVAKQVSERGEVVSEVPLNRKDQRRQEWGEEMLRKFGKEA